MPNYILSIDQGTSSSRAVLVNSRGSIEKISQSEFTQYFPSPGLVEHDANEIWSSQLKVIRALFEDNTINPESVSGIGITNQRETCLLWNKKTGEPLGRAIVWQDRRTANACDQLNASGKFDWIKEKTGLVVDAYFSATKIAWMLKNYEGVEELLKTDDLCAGTIDSWLIFKLTGKHYTDPSNASRTMLFNINTNAWDTELLDLFEIPRSILPKVIPSNSNFGKLKSEILGVEIPIYGVLGDQQAALFGQMCHEPGMAKNTYGTGCFMLMNTGTKKVDSKAGLLSTIAWQLEGMHPIYALEGSVFIAGAAIQWLRDGLKIIDETPDSEYYALKVEDTKGVYVVPAFTGLGAPYWDMYARGGIFGLTRDVDKSHIIRATLESLAYQTYDVLNCMLEDSSVPIRVLKVDGGAANNNLLMQFQADMLNTIIERPANTESTALGVAYLAGIRLGLWTKESLQSNVKPAECFYPEMDKAKRSNLLRGWAKAVSRCKDWEDKD